MRATADMIVSDRPVVLFAVQVYISGQTGGTLIVRDGQNAEAPIVFTIDVNASASKNINLSQGILLSHGLYLDFDAYVTEATVSWLPYVLPIAPSVGNREVSDNA